MSEKLSEPTVITRSRPTDGAHPHVDDDDSSSDYSDIQGLPSNPTHEPIYVGPAEASQGGNTPSAKQTGATPGH